MEISPGRWLAMNTCPFNVFFRRFFGETRLCTGCQASDLLTGVFETCTCGSWGLFCLFGLFFGWFVCVCVCVEKIFSPTLASIGQEFACNGTVVEHPEYGEVIQLQGDQRNSIKSFLIKCKLAKEEQVKVWIVHFQLAKVQCVSVKFCSECLSLFGQFQTLHRHGLRSEPVLCNWQLQEAWNSWGGGAH